MVDAEQAAQHAIPAKRLRSVRESVLEGTL